MRSNRVLSFTKTRLQISLCILIATTISGGIVLAAKRGAGQGYQQVLQAQLQSARSEKRLESQMHVVARTIFQYRRDTGKFPDEGSESERMQRRLSEQAGANAFSELKIDGTETGKTNALSAQTNVLLQVNLSLSPLQLSDVRKTPAHFCKTASPGTIVVLHNTEDYFLVWGAGIDGKPIASSNSQERLFFTSTSIEEEEKENENEKEKKEEDQE